MPALRNVPYTSRVPFNQSTNRNPDSAGTKFDFSVSFRYKPILDCNLNDPSPEVGRLEWYLYLAFRLCVPFGELGLVQ